jgi:hypothetical protein
VVAINKRMECMVWYGSVPVASVGENTNPVPSYDLVQHVRVYVSREKATGEREQ